MNTTQRAAHNNAPAISADLLLPLLVALPVLWALLPGGLVSTADGQVHFIRSAEMATAWRQGVFLPRWSENLGFGLGIPLFIYAPPLPNFITATLHWAGLSLETAYKGMWLVALLINTFGSYRFARDPLGVWSGVVSCAAILYAPLHLRELFIQGNAGQYLAWAFLPWVCWGVIQVFRTEKIGYAIAIALAICGVQLSHHAVALLGAGLAGGLWLFLSIGMRQWRPAALSLGGISLGLALSAWFWAPALLDLNFIRTDVIVASDFHNRFLNLAELIALSPRLDNGAINPYFPMTLGAVQVLLAVCGFCTVIAFSIIAHASPRFQVDKLRLSIPQPARAASFFFSIAFLLGALMTLAWSAPLWDALPFLDLFEFPWRWHGQTYVAMGWLAGLTIYAMGRVAARLTQIAGAVALLLLILSALVNLYPDKLPHGVYSGSPSDVVRYEQRTGQVGTTSLGEFNPRWVEGVLITSPLVDDYLAGRVVDRLPDPLPPGVTGEPLASSVQRHDFMISAQQPVTLTLDLHYFPGWRAFGNDAPLATAPHPGSGLIDVALPAGEETLSLRFGATPLRRSAELFSLAAWLGLVLLLGWLGWRRRRATQLRSSSQGEEPTGLFPVIAPVALIIAFLVTLRGFGENWFTFTSPSDQALDASTTLQADFGDRVRVLGVDLPSALVQPGASVAATVYLRARQPLDQDYSIFLHLDRPDGVTVASAQSLHPGDIPTSKWATGLHVRAPLRLVAPMDLPPMRYRLRIGIVEPKSGEWLSLADGSGDVLEIGQVWVDGEPQTAPEGPQARFGSEIRLLGARIESGADTLHLYWQADRVPQENLTVFVHLLDSQGNLVAQQDGAPFAGQYPPAAWRPGQVIEDVRPLPSLTGIAQVAVGVYDLQNGERLRAADERGAPLANDALLLSVE